MNVTMFQYTLWTWRWIWLIFLLLKFWHPRRIFDVPMNKTLQELSSSITKAVQYYMTQRTPDNTLHPHTHAHTYTHMHTLHTFTNQMSTVCLLIAPVTRFSNVPFKRCKQDAYCPHAHTYTHTRATPYNAACGVPCLGRYDMTHMFLVLCWPAWTVRPRWISTPFRGSGVDLHLWLCSDVVSHVPFPLMYFATSLAKKVLKVNFCFWNIENMDMRQTLIVFWI